MYQLSEEEISFCESHTWPISGQPDGVCEKIGKMAELKARNRAIGKYQTRNRLTNKQCAGTFGVSPSTWSRWLAMDSTPPATVCFYAVKHTPR